MSNYIEKIDHIISYASEKGWDATDFYRAQREKANMEKALVLYFLINVLTSPDFQKVVFGDDFGEKLIDIAKIEGFGKKVDYIYNLILNSEPA